MELVRIREIVAKTTIFLITVLLTPFIMNILEPTTIHWTVIATISGLLLFARLWWTDFDLRSVCWGGIVFFILFALFADYSLYYLQRFKDEYVTVYHTSAFLPTLVLLPVATLLSSFLDQH